jgi:hypothetical protein
VNKSLVARIDELEARERIAGPVIVFPTEIPSAFCVGGVRFVAQAGERLDDAVRRVAALVRPGARIVRWPVPMRPD